MSCEGSTWFQAMSSHGINHWAFLRVTDVCCGKKIAQLVSHHSAGTQSLAIQEGRFFLTAIKLLEDSSIGDSSSAE